MLNLGKGNLRACFASGSSSWQVGGIAMRGTARAQLSVATLTCIVQVGQRIRRFFPVLLHINRHPSSPVASRSHHPA